MCAGYLRTRHTCKYKMIKSDHYNQVVMMTSGHTSYPVISLIENARHISKQKLIGLSKKK